MKICLSIETTARFWGVALISFGKSKKSELLASYYEDTPVKQSDLLVPTIDATLKEAGLSRTHLSLIAVDVGPGSFTGVRVGLAAARALGQALDLPVSGVTSLDAMVWNEAKQKPSALFVPWLSALQNEVYYAVYRGATCVKKPVWAPESELKLALKKKGAMAIGTPPHPNAVGEAAIEKFLKSRSRNEFHFEEAVPLYLQPSWAERARKKKAGAA